MRVVLVLVSDDRVINRKSEIEQEVEQEKR